MVTDKTVGTPIYDELLEELARAAESEPARHAGPDTTDDPQVHQPEVTQP